MQQKRTDPEKPIGEPLYLRVDFVSIYKVFNQTLRLPRHQPLAIAYSEMFKFRGAPIIPHSLFYARSPHPALNSTLLT